MAKIILKCKYCEKEFSVHPYRLESNVGYCSRKCYIASKYKERKAFICKYCHKEFKVYPSIAIHRTPVYCSRDCRTKDKTVKLVCPTCNKQFISFVSQKKKYCSKECAAVTLLSKNSPDVFKYDPKKHVVASCPICGNNFSAYKSQYRKYCSASCQRRATHFKKGQRPWNLRYGNIVLRVKRRDNNSCVICGYSKIVHVHHIIPLRQEGFHSENNLVCLCPNHHEEAHRKLIDLVSIMKERNFKIG